MQLVSRAEGACTGNWRTPCRHVVERQSPCFNQGFGRYCILQCFVSAYTPRGHKQNPPKLSLRQTS